MDLLSNSDKLRLIEKKLDEVYELLEELRDEVLDEEIWGDDD